MGVGRGRLRGGPRAQRPGAAERRVRRLPLVPRDGARVVRGPRDRGVHERALRQREGRPRGAARRRRGLHGGHHGDDRARRLADDLRARPRGHAVLRRHLLPRPATPRQPELPAGAGGARPRLARARRRRTPGGRRDPRPPAGPGRGGERDHRRRHARRGRGEAGARVRRHVRRLRWRAEVPAVDGAGVPAAPPRPRPTPGTDGRSRCSTRPAWRWPAAASTTRSGEGSRATPSTPAGWCRTSRRCSTTTPSCSVSTPAGEATGSPRRPPTSCSASCAPPRAASPPRWTPTARGWRASSTPGPPSSSGPRSATTTARGRPRRSRSPRPAPSSTAPPRSS